jgi:hypothetical protein
VISPTLTALAQRELGPGYLVRITDYPHTYSERLELLGHAPSIVDENYTVFCVVCHVTLSYDHMAASELSICGQRRKALENLVADRLAETA